MLAKLRKDDISPIKTYSLVQRINFSVSTLSQLSHNTDILTSFHQFRQNALTY